MPTRTSLRRAFAGVATLGATAALAMLPGSAHALVTTEYAALASSSASYVGPTSGGTCDLASGQDSEPISGIATFHHGTKHRSIDLKNTYTSSDDSADKLKVKGHLDTSMTLRRQGKDLKSFEVTAGGTLTATHTVSHSACALDGAVVQTGTENFAFTEHHAGWFYLTRDTTRPHSFVQFALVNVKSGDLVALDFYQGTKSHVTSRAKLKPGTYVVDGPSSFRMGLALGNAGGIPLKSASLTRTATQTLHLTGQFKRISR
jgi:hypothetical protein